MPKKPAAKVDWHRYFGVLLFDFFTGTPYEVEPEKDLSLHKQLLDVVIIRKGEGEMKEPLPDGLDDLNAHNLITFKSYHEALDDFALKELTGHYVNYLKLVSGRGKPLLPEDQFHLYAVCGRDLMKLPKQVKLHEIKQGVYDCHRGSDRFRVVVASQVPQTPNNAPLHFFTASQERFRFAAKHYRPRSEETSTLLDRLIKGYHLEGIDMPFSMEEYFQDWLKNESQEFLAKMSPKWRVQGLTAAQLEVLLEERRAEEAAAKAKKPRRHAKDGPA